MILHAMWLLFALVFVNQGGVPIPVAPSLLMAGARVAAGRTNFLTAALVSVGAALAADFVWYGLGRWRGTQARELVARISRSAAARVELAERRFSAHRTGFLLGARFLPELNPLAAGVAGATGMAPRRYALVATTSALVWAATWLGTGYVLGPVVTGIPIQLLVTALGLCAVTVGAVGAARRHIRWYPLLLVLLTGLVLSRCTVGLGYERPLIMQVVGEAVTSCARRSSSWRGSALYRGLAVPT